MPENQHYVPRLLLKNFSEPRKDEFYIYAFDKHKDEDNVFNPNIKGIAAENGFYDLTYGNNSLSLEKNLTELEGKAAKIIKKILQEKNLAHITKNDRFILALFLSVQFVRTKEHRLRFSHIQEMLIDRLTDQKYPKEVIEKLKQETTDPEDNKLMGLKSLIDAGLYVPQFLKKTWVLYQTTQDDPFYTSDNPIAMFNDQDFGLYGNIGLSVPGIEIYLPLSTTLCLGLICPVLSNQILVANEQLDKIPEPVQELINGLMQGTSISVNSDNVLRFNSLQVMYSSRFVFCQAPNFDLVYKMLDDDPNYKHGLKSTMAS